MKWESLPKFAIWLCSLKLKSDFVIENIRFEVSKERMKLKSEGKVWLKGLNFEVLSWSMKFEVLS